MNFLKMAVFIDAENFANKEWVAAVVSGLRQIMDVGVCRAFASYRPSRWDRDFLNEHNIEINEIPRAAAGKDAADKHLLVNATKLVAERRFYALAVLTSDSDCLPLAREAREAGMIFWGIGEDKAPTAYKAACTEFLTPNLFLGEDAGKIIATLRKNVLQRYEAEKLKGISAKKSPVLVQPIASEAAEVKKFLITLAAEKKTITYGDLGGKFQIPARFIADRCLDKISDETKKERDVLLSVLVVAQKKPQLPSLPFFQKAKSSWGYDLNPDDAADRKRFFEEERDRVFDCYDGSKK